MKPVVFFDLDGVLADFVGGALKAHGKELPPGEVQWDFCTQIGFSGVNDAAFWSPLGFDFWAGLGVLPDGLCLLRAVERLVDPDRIAFLSSPCESPGCVDGKRAWVAAHFPEYRRRLFLGSAKHLFAGPGKVLVDDHDANIDGFHEAGGQTVCPPRPWNRWKAECLAGGLFDVGAVTRHVRSCVEAIENPVSVRASRTSEK